MNQATVFVNGNASLLNQKKERNSNFEWLRIIAIIMIIFHHYCRHGQIDIALGSSFNRALYTLFSAYGKLAVVIFVMISGYFSCKSKFNFKRLVLLLAETVFYSVVWYIVACIIGEENFAIMTFVKSFSVLLSSKYWFFTCYMALSIMAPLLNIIVKNLSRKQHLIVCVAGGVIYSLIESIAKGYLYYNELIYFMYLYIVAAYIRLYNGKHTIRFDVVGFVVAFVVSWILYLVYYYMPDGFSLQEFIIYPFSLQSPTNLFMGIFLINICKKRKPTYSKCINYIAPSAFGIYLIHDSMYRNVLWVKIFNNAAYYSQTALIFALHMFVTVTIVFVVSLIIDILRRELLERHFSKTYDLCYAKIKTKYDNRIENNKTN